MGKKKIGIYCYLTADIVTKSFTEMFLGFNCCLIAGILTERFFRNVCWVVLHQA